MDQDLQDKHCATYLNQFTYSNDEELAFVRAHLVVKEYRKGEFLLQRGDVQGSMSFVCEGLLRRYYINEKANEITTGFVKEYEFATDYPAFIRQKPTRQYLQFLEHSITINLPYEVIQESYERDRGNERNGRLIAEKVLTILSDRVEWFLFNSAEERYLSFVEENPDLMNRVSLTHLSSFLGIERQSLSRIRKKLAGK